MLVTLSLMLVLIPFAVCAQDRLPYDNGIFTYHTAPRYRDSESHPLRILAYAVHPIGWLARELVFRPISYFASSTEVTRSVMGYREPFDFRQPECFSADDSVPDCRAYPPYNYGAADEGKLTSDVERHVYFPDVNFDFNVRRLNDLGVGRAHQISQLLEKSPGVRVVLGLYPSGEA